MTGRLNHLDNEIASKKKRQDKLFDVLETTELELSDIAPRIKKLSSEIADLEKERDHLEQRLVEKEIPELDEYEIEPYVNDLRNTLKLGTIV